MASLQSAMALSYSFLSRQALPRPCRRRRVLRIEPDGLVVVSDGDVILFSLQPDIGSPDIFSPIARVRAIWPVM